MPKFEVLRRYLKILFTADKWISVGALWNLAHKHTLNKISGLDAVKYNKDPIRLL